MGWANQSWTGVWHGAPERMLIEQTYPGVDDHRRHFDALVAMFADPRYLRVDGRPVFYVQEPAAIPDVERWVALWQQLADAAGLGGLFLVGESTEVRGNPNTTASTVRSRSGSRPRAAARDGSARPGAQRRELRRGAHRASRRSTGTSTSRVSCRGGTTRRVRNGVGWCSRARRRSCSASRSGGRSRRRTRRRRADGSCG